MIIREARLKDAGAIAQVHVDSSKTTYTGILPEDHIQKFSYQKREQHWKNMLGSSAEKKTDYFIYVAENTAQEIVGFIDGGLARSENSSYQGEIYCLYILEAYQRQGIGRSLVQLIADKLSQSGINSILVWVLADNPAVRFYQALGGQQIAQKLIIRSGIEFEEIAYGWNNIKSLT